MDRNGGYRHNNYNVIYDKACDIATNIKNQLQQPNQLPPHSNLLLENEHGLNMFETYALIQFTSPNSNKGGHIVVGDPEFMQRNMQYPDLNGNNLHMFCSIDAFNGYFMDMSVNSLEEVLEVLEFCQQLLDYQPDEDELNFVRVPNHMLNHLFVPERLRQRNLRENNMNMN